MPRSPRGGTDRVRAAAVQQVRRKWQRNGRGFTVERPSPEWNNPQAVREDRRARDLLGLLLAHGFVPFHVDFGPLDSHTLCCGTEYSLVNSRAPPERLRLAGR